MIPVMETLITELAAALANAERVTMITGAGVSAESGVPTFRGPDGLWRGHDPTQLATPQAFAADPDLVWEFYNWRRELIASVEPNPAHYAIAKLEQLLGETFLLVTQNVDGLHRLAGSRNLIEIHGSLWTIRCTECGAEKQDRSTLPPRPLCESCSGLMRPGVVWFNEAMPELDWMRTIEACQNTTLLLVAGTSAVVQPVASLAMAAKSLGATVAEINLDPTPNSEHMDYFLQGKAGEILPRVAEETSKHNVKT